MRSLPSNSLERALIMLKFISEAPDGLTNRELSCTFGLARSTCSYILSRLEKEGYLVRNVSDGRYKIGLSTLVLGRNALRAIGLRAGTVPTLYRLASKTGLAANLAVLEAHRLIISDRVEGPPFVKAAIEDSGNERSDSFKRPTSTYLNHKYTDIGDQLPIDTTALGRVFLAYLPEQELPSFLADRERIEGESNPLAFLSELDAIRTNGYSMMPYEPHNESCSLAAPIFDETNKIRAAVSVSCRRYLSVWKDERALSETVKEAAWEISRELNRLKSVRQDSNMSSRLLQRPLPSAEPRENSRHY